MLISVLGYMGSGKSQVSKILSQKLHFTLVDLDEEIATREQKTVSQIFSEKREIYFRTKEKEVLQEILNLSSNCVLSLGGGTPAYFNNMDLICAQSVSVFLQTSVPVLKQRLLPEKKIRPLIAKIPDEKLEEFIAKHLFERNQFYSKAALTVLTDHKTSDQIAEEIIRILPR